MVFLGIALLLVGCAPQSTPSPSPNASPTLGETGPPVTEEPSAELTPEPTVAPFLTERPDSLWAFDCAAVAAVFDTALDGLTFIDPPHAPSEGYLDNPGSWLDSVTNQGGLHCVWTNDVGRAYLGEPYIYTRGSPIGGLTDARYLAVVALPGASGGFETAYGFRGQNTITSSCQYNRTHGYTNADVEARRGDDWLRINLMLPPAACDQWMPRMSGIFDQIAAARLPGSLARPAGVPAVPENCQELIAPVDALLPAPLGIAPFMSVLYSTEPMPSLLRGKLHCAWGSEWQASLTVLEAGSWLLPHHAARMQQFGEAVEIKAAGLAPGDQAWRMHDAEGTVIFWVSLRGNLYRGWMPSGTDDAGLGAFVDALAEWQGTP